MTGLPPAPFSLETSLYQFLVPNSFPVSNGVLIEVFTFGNSNWYIDD